MGGGGEEERKKRNKTDEEKETKKKKYNRASDDIGAKELDKAMPVGSAASFERRCQQTKTIPMKRFCGHAKAPEEIRRKNPQSVRLY